MFYETLPVGGGLMHLYPEPKWYVTWSLVLLGIAWGAIAFYGATPHLEHLLPDILHHWWSHVVPTVFPALVASELIIHSIGLRGNGAGMMRSFASWPIVGATRILDQSLHDASPEVTYRALTWANLYNPWLFSHLWIGLWVNASLLGAAWLMTGSLPGPVHSIQRRSPRPRTASLDAMNWATILLAELIVARVMQNAWTHWMYQLWVEPTTSPRVATPIGLGALALNGLVCMVPLLLYTHYRGLSWPHVLRLRITQMLWAVMLGVPLGLLVPQLRPVSLQILQHLVHFRF